MDYNISYEHLFFKVPKDNEQIALLRFASLCGGFQNITSKSHLVSDLRVYVELPKDLVEANSSLH